MDTSTISLVVIFSGGDVRLHQLDLVDLHLVWTFKYRQKKRFKQINNSLNFLKLIFLQLIFFVHRSTHNNTAENTHSEDPKPISETNIGS